MYLMRRKEAPSLPRTIDDLFSELASGWRDDSWASFEPRINVSETEKELKVTAELPGMEKKDVSVEVDNGMLTIKGEKKQETEDKGEKWYRVERVTGSFYRSVALNVDVDAAKCKATLDNGVLKVSLPKKEEKSPKNVSIEVK